MSSAGAAGQRADVEGDVRPGSLQAPLSTLDIRYWLAAITGTAGALLLLGIPTAVIPNPFFMRMIPTEDFNLLVWIVSAPLIGLLLATYGRPGSHSASHQRGGFGTGRATFAGIAAFLAIGCPICNKLVVAVLGSGTALRRTGRSCSTATPTPPRSQTSGAR